jgi:polyisoprenoid-binding protein YceI
MTSWTIDSSHSAIDFKVRHMGIASVKGQFTEFEGVAVSEGRTLKNVEATIKAASVSTNDDKRDAHLRSADFFDVERYPEITFKSTKVEPQGQDRYRVTGDLTMRGQTHPVTFEVEAGEAINDPFGLVRAAANVRGKLNRTTWSLKWNQVLEAGSLLVGEEVMFDFDVQAVTQPKEVQAV